MTKHDDLGQPNFAAMRKLKTMISNGKISLGGNKVLKIYGTLECRSGKRMKKQNRVFFADESEAIENGYRPCGHCMPAKYREWKALFNRQTSP
jgi:methylphosphotriester-DNA--protein-cysteine methyltransferase